MGERLDGLPFVKLDVSVRKKMLSRAQLATKPLHGVSYLSFWVAGVGLSVRTGLHDSV